jgi:hypothetical protein
VCDAAAAHAPIGSSQQAGRVHMCSHTHPSTQLTAACWPPVA